MLAVLALAMVMAACGGAGDVDPAAEGQDPAGTEPAAPEGTDAGAANIPTDPEEIEGTLRFSWWGSQIRNEKTNAVIDLFEEAYPNVTIQRETADFFPHWEKLTVQAAANDQPCIIQMQSRFMSNYAPRNVLRPLDDLVEAGAIDTSGVPDVFMDSGRYDGELYSIPTGVFYFVMMYNADYLAQAGLEEPTPEWTWDDLKQLLLDAVGQMPEGVAPAQNMGPDPEPFYAYIQSHGQPVFDEASLGFDQQLMIDWFEMWEELREAGATNSIEAVVEEPDSFEESNLGVGSVMLDNKAANQLDGHQDALDAAPNAEGTLKMQKHPNGPEGAGDDLGTNGMSIGANCPEENVPAAAAWINFFLNNEEGAEIYASDNGVVTVESLREAQINDPNTLPGQKRNLELIDTIVEFEPEPVVYPPGYAALLEAQERAYESVAFGRQSVEEAVDEFFSEAERLLAQGAQQ